MNPAAVILLVASLCGCAHRQPSREGAAGPSAKVQFISPYLEDRFLARDRLRLLVMEPDPACAFTVKGTIPLSKEANSFAVIPANRRVYFRVQQSSREFMGASYNRQLDFSFTPEDGERYTVEHIDSPAGFRMKYYKHDQEGKKSPIEVQDFDACEK